MKKQSDPTIQRKRDQEALKFLALKYDLRPSQVRELRGDLRALRNEIDNQSDSVYDMSIITRTQWK